ncbi:MAG: hypothetical protein SXG53_02415 [Pseudomonadota bacterium]|nr:hypothetical protein [Pseudomonadota bacterium]
MDIKCRDWQAWVNTMLPGPNKLIVAGDVVVGNPGIEVFLTMREPQGMVGTTLVLDLQFYQKPGMWTQNVTCASAYFERIVPQGKKYTLVTIHNAGQAIAEIKVQEAS